MARGDGLLGNTRRRLTAQTASAVLMVAAVLGGLYVGLHWVQQHLRRYPFLVMLFPPIAMASIAVVIPLFMFISYQVWSQDTSLLGTCQQASLDKCTVVQAVSGHQNC
ncbi:hypothetical protein COO60DRAFT_770194 [Scenedesmus sp. NREL 46B-D3]|nr:hypothetical protein COO60DRAFT_770194 [Scenedesmus sp. NREL 46B-D3]